MTTWKDDRNKPEPKKRPVPQMPEGYYSGDKPNPHLREFVEKNMTPYDPEHDDYQVEPFNEAITTTKATAIYNMHTYWSKKPMMPSGSTSAIIRNRATSSSTPSAAREARLSQPSWKAGRPSPSTARLLLPLSPRTTARLWTSLNCRRPSRS
ncbi:MAG: hypothetical protein WCW68_13330 [Methanothrix sp.]